jgi:glucosamine-6-phosphate deaminase
MEIVIRQHEQQCGVTAADIMADAVRCGATTLGLATGSSPLSVYQELIRRHRKDRLRFADVQAFLLDEYVGLPPSHPQSYAHVIRGGGDRRRRRRSADCKLSRIGATASPTCDGGDR